LLLLISSFKETILRFAFHLRPEMSVLFLSMLPIFELRGGIPIGVAVLKLPLYKAVIFSLIGNLIPVLPILYFLKIFSNVPLIKKLLKKTESRGNLVKKYEALGLTLFVGIPLPVTGAWTGSALAFIFAIPPLKAFLFISLGVFIAAIIVSILTAMGIAGAIIAGIGISALVIISFLKKSGRIFILISFLFLFIGGCSMPFLTSKGQDKEIRIGTISFSGNKKISSKNLASVMSVKKGSVYKEELLRADMERLIEYYRNKGFFDAKIVERKGNFDEKRRVVNFTFRIYEGIRSKVKTIKFIGNTVFNDKELGDIIGLHKGDFFDAAKLGKGEYLLTTKYADLGYVDIEIKSEKRVESNGVNLTIFIKEGTKFYVKSIAIDGLKSVRRKIVTREIVLKKGKAYSTRDAYRSQSRLYSTLLFSDVNFSLQKVSKDSLIVHFHLKETPARWFGFGTGYESPDRIMLNVDWGNNNLFNNLQKIELKINNSFNFRREFYVNVGVDYEEPYFLGKNIHFLLHPEYRYVKKKEYREWLELLNVELQKYILSSTRISASFNFREAKLDTSGPVAGVDTFALAKATNSFMVQYFSEGRDNIINPFKGYYLSFSYEYAGGFFRGYNQFERYVFDDALYISLYRKSVFAIHTRFGYTVPRMDPENITPDVRFELGGWSSIRGYDNASIGALDSRGQRSGLYLFLFNLEARIRLNKWFYSYLFYDGGNLFLFSKQLNFGDVKKGAGFGIGFMTPIGPIRVDYGKRFTDVSPKDKGRLYINFGNPF